jgi:hypothetical protein
MSDPKYALTGKALRGRIDFSAASQGEMLLKQGGQWKAGEYVAQVQPLARQLDTIDITAVLNSTAYSVTVDGKVYTITSDGTATDVEIRDALMAAINAISPANGVTAQLVDSDTFTVRGIVGGVPHVVSVGANLALSSGLETVPNFSAYKDDGRVVVRTSSAFTGAFDVLVQG